MGRNGFEYIVGMVPGVHRCNRRVRWRQGGDGEALPTDLLSDIQGWLKIRPTASLMLSCESWASSRVLPAPGEYRATMPACRRCTTDRV
jgi:hypothetical protein